MEAYSEETGQTYPNFEALVAHEANGYAVTAIISDGKQSWPWTVGPFDTKYVANLAAARLRRRMKKEQPDYPDHTHKVFVRPCWKPSHS